MEDSPKNRRIRQLLAELKAWCDQKHGRRVEAAAFLGVKPSAVSDWFYERKHHTGEQALAIQELLGIRLRRRKTMVT